MILRINLVQDYSSKFGNNQQQLTVTDGVCKHHTSKTAESYVNGYDENKGYDERSSNKCSTNYSIITKKSGTTRTTSSSQCTTSTPMKTFTPTIAWCTSCVELAHSAHCSTPDDGTSHLMAEVLSSIHSHPPRSYSWLVLFDSISPFFLYLSFLPFSVFFLFPELFLELDNPIVMASLRYSVAEESVKGMYLAPHIHETFGYGILT